jgi:hypothetical protein
MFAMLRLSSLISSDTLFIKTEFVLFDSDIYPDAIMLQLYLYLMGDYQISASYSIMISNKLGQLIYFSNYNVSANGKKSVNINCSSYSSGMYLLTLVKNGVTILKQNVIKI